MVYGAQRFEAGAGFGYQTIGAGFLGRAKKIAEEFHGEAGHVAGDDEVPIGRGNAESRIEPADWPAFFDVVGHDGIAQAGVALRRTDQRDVPGGGANSRGGLFEQRPVPEGQKRLVAAHPGAESARQHKSGPHEMMVTGEFVPRRGDVADGNKKVYICFLVAFAMLAASSIRAEESSGAPEHRTFVVRADPRTGRLVRSVVVSPVPAGATKSGALAGKGSTEKDVSGLVEQAAKAHDVDPLLVRSMIEIESGYNPYAVSPKGAEGLMQLTPPTARMLGVSNSFDPQQNIEAGVKYLRYLQGIYKDDRLALAAYNAGPGAVEKYKRIPPYRETQNYVYQVGKRYGEARKAVAAPPPAEVKEPAPAAAPEHPKLEHFVDENGRLHLRTAP